MPRIVPFHVRLASELLTAGTRRAVKSLTNLVLGEDTAVHIAGSWREIIDAAQHARRLWSLGRDGLGPFMRYVEGEWRRAAINEFIHNLLGSQDISEAPGVPPNVNKLAADGVWGGECSKALKWVHEEPERINYYLLELFRSFDVPNSGSIEVDGKYGSQAMYLIEWFCGMVSYMDDPGRQ